MTVTITYEGKNPVRNSMKRVGWVAGLATVVGIAVTPMAMASGVGNTVNGCTAQWFSTAFSLNCNSVSTTGYYQSKGNCTSEVDKNGAATKLSSGTTRNGVSSAACTWEVTSASALFLG